MFERLRSLRLFARDAEEPGEEEATAPAFPGLRLFAAKLLLSSGANATLFYLRSRSAGRDPGLASAGPGSPTGGGFADSSRLPTVAAWVPVLLGAAACTAQLRHALDPSPQRQMASNILNGAVIGMGIGGAADTALSAARGERAFSLAPLLFGYTGLLGFLVDRQENAVAEQEAELGRRARLVERWVPRRRTKVDRIVVHV